MQNANPCGVVTEEGERKRRNVNEALCDLRESNVEIKTSKSFGSIFTVSARFSITSVPPMAPSSVTSKGLVSLSIKDVRRFADCVLKDMARLLHCCNFSTVEEPPLCCVVSEKLCGHFSWCLPLLPHSLGDGCQCHAEHELPIRTH
jgi:hypothetical protein